MSYARIVPVSPSASEAIDVVSKVLSVGASPIPAYMPELFIVNSADIVAELFETLGPEVTYRDVVDMIGHVVVRIFMYASDPMDIDHMDFTPNFHAMRSTAFFKDSHKWGIAQQACLRFAAKLWTRLTALTILPAGDGCYMFKDLINYDIVLEKVHVPY